MPLFIETDHGALPADRKTTAWVVASTVVLALVFACLLMAGLSWMGVLSLAFAPAAAPLPEGEPLSRREAWAFWGTVCGCSAVFWVAVAACAGVLP